MRSYPPTQTSSAQAAHIDYECAPLSIVIARYLLPFWLFRDASRGDRLTRAAAYRHNRSMRGYLPGYILRWTVQALLALGLIFIFDAGARGAFAGAEVLVLLAAGAGIAFACCVCMLFVISYAYLYFSRND